jgi:hypothetical protein
MEQERLVALDQELVEGEAGGQELGKLGADAKQAVCDLVDAGSRMGE